MRKLWSLIPAALLAASLPAAADGVKIGKKIPFAASAEVRDAIRKECDLETDMATWLRGELKGAEAVDDVKGAKGRVFDAKIAGVWAAGGPWGMASILVEGELRENGKVIGTVASRRNTARGGGACGKLSVSGKAVAEDIAQWMKAPVMDARLGDAVKK